MNLFRRLRPLFRRQQTEAEMAEEMRFHLEQRAAEFAADGLPDAEARLAAERRFGNTAAVQEQAREAHGWGWLERFGKDLVFAVRHLRKSPGFTLLAIVTLGLGIGANTSMFSILNDVLLRPLPFADLDRLERLYRSTAQNRNGHFSVADFLDLQRAKDGFGELAAYTTANASLSEPGQPAEFAYTARITPDLFALLGVSPQLGRGFHAGEDVPGRDRVVVLSQRTWRNRFSADPSVIGRVIRIDGEPHEVVGVLPASFNDWRYLGDIDLFLPLALRPAQIADRQTTLLRILGKRALAKPAAEAAAFVADFGRQLAAAHPDVNAGSTWRTVPLQRVAAGDGSRSVLPMLIGLSGFVLLIACSNLANLLLARTIARAREFAVRAALGASRTQLLRPLIAEALLLSLAGGLLAIVVALWFGDWAAVRSTGDNGEQVHFVLDWRVTGWAFAAALGTAFAFGIAPALFALRLDLNGALKSGGRGMTGSRGHQRLRHVLIVGQFALAMVLLAGAGLFLRGLHELNNRRSGWVSTHLVTGTVLLPSAKYADPDAIAAFHRAALERLAALPGVASAGISTFTPFFSWPDIRKFVVEGRQRPQPGREPAAMINCVTPGYFDAVGTRMLAGRNFSDFDTAGAPPVCIVSETTAQVLFGPEDPIGRRFEQTMDGTKAFWEIVGVANDVRSINPDPGPVSFQIYRPLTQEAHRQIEIALRADGVPPAVLAEAIRDTISQLDPDLPVRKLMHADARIVRANYQLGVLRDVLLAIAVLGLGLASLGIYGVIARTMAQRSAEFAIRLALGAGLQNITRLVLAAGVRLALLGSALGLLGAVGVSRLIQSAFPDLPAHTAAVLVATTLLLVAVALLACWLPARRAAKVDAVSVLRAE